MVALNMMDVASSRSYEISIDRLAQELGAPVVPMVATRRESHDKLLQAIVDVSEGRKTLERARPYYGTELEEHISELEKVIAKDEELSRKFPIRWLAIKLLEEDSEIVKQIGVKV